MHQLRLFVGGMSSRRCVREVTARLRDVPGVETVSADPADYTVQLSGSMDLTDVLAAFTGTSYRPRVDDDARDGTERACGGTESEGPAGGDSGGTAVGKSAT
jgi:copper chaperone CopZ